MAGAWIAFHLTDRCQLDCQHCLRDPQQKPTDLSLELIERVLDQARTVYRASHASLTGGEPTLHPQFADVVDAIASRGMSWHVVTNGRRFDTLAAMLAERPMAREKLTVVNFSIDGASEATHDRIRGKGSFREVMSAISLATVHDIPFVVQLTINALNAHEVEAFALLGSHLGAKRVQFGMLQATGTLHDQALYLPPKQWKGVHETIARLRQALRIDITTSEGFYTPNPFHVCEPFRSEQLHVDVQGRLSLCCMHAGVPGPEDDVAGDLAEVGLLQAHKRLVGIIHDAQARKLALMERGPLAEWDLFPCNACMKLFGKPHWQGDRASGPTAQRERWTGAWAPERQAARNGEPVRLPIVR
jgi:MoaA/NifB/PqqE/SkfB family radical SAM enzyme